MKTLCIGSKVQFNPFKGIRVNGIDKIDVTMTGTVIYINDKHRMFTAEYESGNTMQKVSFNFVDIGINVEVL